MKTFSIFLLLTLTGTMLHAQDSSRLKPVFLEELPGFTQTIFYSAGAQARANEIAQFMEGAGNFFQQEINFTPKVQLHILAPVHWKLVAAKPLHDVYGFPHNIDQVRLAIAAEDNDFWRSYIPDMEKLPVSMAEQVKKAYSQPDGSVSMRPFFDLLALHEMGHSYTSQGGLKMHRYWMSELFVNIMLHTYVAEKQPALLPALEVFPALVLSKGTADYSYTSLADFEKLYPSLGMGPLNYGWYQCMLHTAAKDIYNAAGKSALTKLWTALKKHQEPLSDEELVKMLMEEVDESVANVFLKWHGSK